MVFIHLFRILRKCSFWVTLKYLTPNHKPYSFDSLLNAFVPIKIWRLWYINIFNKNLHMQNRWIASEVFKWQMSITIRLSRLIDCDCRSFQSLMVGSTIFLKQMFDFLLKALIIKCTSDRGISTKRKEFFKDCPDWSIAIDHIASEALFNCFKLLAIRIFRLD